MKNDQTSKLNANEQVANFINRNIVALNAIEGFEPIYDVFKNSSTKLHEALKQQEKIGEGLSPTAENHKKIMAETIYLYLLRAKVKANDGAHIELFTTLNKPKSYYNYGAKTVIVQRAKETRDTLNNNLAFLTNITPAIITEIDSTIDDYNKSKDEPLESIKSKKIKGTDVIPELFEVNDQSIENMYNLAMSYLFKTNKELVNGFAAAKQVVYMGSRHTSIQFELVDVISNEPIIGSKIIDESTKKTYITDADGVVNISTHRAGQFHFTITAAGKPNKDFVALIKQSKENVFEIKL